MKSSTTLKITLGFIFAGTLLISVGIVTYFSVKSLMESVKYLSDPDEKIDDFNELLYKIYQLDKVHILFDNDSTKIIDFINDVNQRISILKENSLDSTEYILIENIELGIKELIIVNENLYDVKTRLRSREFDKNSFQNLELTINRLEERVNLNNLEILGRNLNKPDLFSSLKRENIDESIDSLYKENSSSIRQDDILENINQDISRLGRNTSPESITAHFNEYLRNYNLEEKNLRGRLAFLENQLTIMRNELTMSVQSIISELKQQTIELKNTENNAAYKLSIAITYILITLITIGIIGSLAFIFTIIRQVKKSEKYNLQLRKAKIKSENLAKAKQDFLANMSHEIRNPLHVIQGYLEVLKNTRVNKKQIEYLNLTSFATENLRNIVNDILDFSKIEAGKLKLNISSFNPYKNFNDCFNFFKQSSDEKGIDLILKLILPESLWLYGDAQRIQQILTNLISNAIKFTEKGFVKVTISYFNENLHMIVEDSGVGMSKSFQKELFSEFTQESSDLNRAFDGTGLGLAITHKLITLMQGKIEICSEKGKGSIFNVTIPLPKTTMPVDTNDESLRFSLKNTKVLLVDDDEIVLRFSKLLLKNLGAETVVYNGGQEFKDKFKPDQFDFALIDVQMPKVNGYEVLKILRKNPMTKDIVVFAITANVFAKESQNLPESGFDGIILKPFNEKELLNGVSKQISLPVHNLNKRREKKIELPDSLTNIKNSSDIGSYDLEEIKNYCMGDEEFLEELILDFCKQTEEDLSMILQAFELQDLTTVKYISHKLSSRLKQFKINTAEMAKSIEDDIDHRKNKNLREKIEKFTSRTFQVIDELKLDLKLS